MGAILQGELSTADGMTGELSALENLLGSLSAQESLSGSLSAQITYKSYEGSYEVDPKFSEQVLDTQNKLMTRDLVVNAIYVSETTNPQGGLTVYIGGEFING